MKKSYITFLILSIINSIVLTGIIIGNHKPIDSTEIFKNNIDSVVEVKASTSDIGESYGSGVIYSSDGHGIPNLSNKVLDWLNKNGWCLNGVKSK